MIKSQLKKINRYTGEYLSIGVTVDGEPRNTIGVVWESTVNAFNMRTPQIYISPEDLQDEEIMKLLKTYKIIGCYIWAPLNDYSFLADFKDIEDINIRNGDALENLDFLSELYECRMFYLQNAKLKDLNIIVNLKKNSKTMFGCFQCIGFDNCQVDDLSVMESEKVHFSEFLIWKPQGRNESEKWSVIDADKKKYYEYKE